ncbi:MAG: ABC transporter permease [Verrucomicrobia bacterium]|nr:ABC transporter permease [Verrucomicrobiota bacterium]
MGAMMSGTLWFSRLGWLSRYGLVLALAGITLGLAAVNPNFLAPQNLWTLLRQVSINGILAVGVTYVLLTGGVDLSLGSMVALAGVVAAHGAHPGGYPWGVPVLMGVMTGVLGGGFNGLAITRGRVPPFIATLGMMTAARGLALVLSGGRPVSNLSREFTRLSSAEVLGIPVPVVVLGVTAWGSHVVLRHLRLGRHVYAVGGNENAARASGISVEGVKLFAYAVCGGLAGLAGVVQAARITTGQPNTGIMYELDAIAAAVIGGTSLSGGVGGIGGTLLGVLLLGVISSGLDWLGVSSYYQQIVKGAIILGAVWLDRRGEGRGENLIEPPGGKP